MAITVEEVQKRYNILYQGRFDLCLITFFWNDYNGDTLQVETSLFAMSFKKPPASIPSEFGTSSCQLDLVFSFSFNSRYLWI